MHAVTADEADDWHKRAGPSAAMRYADGGGAFPPPWKGV